jgi:hypothetical protein
MTNRELLNMPRSRLSEVDKQRLFLLRVEGTPMPCPACGKKVNAFDAAGITIDQYDFGKSSAGYSCPSCKAELEQVVPAFSLGPLWHWQLRDEWLKRQLQKARQADQTVKESEKSA